MNEIKIGLTLVWIGLIGYALIWLGLNIPILFWIVFICLLVDFTGFVANMDEDKRKGRGKPKRTPKE